MSAHCTTVHGSNCLLVRAMEGHIMCCCIPLALTVCDSPVAQRHNRNETVLHGCIVATSDVNKDLTFKDKDQDKD